ncbi:helix-turn-helix domain-containing protein [Streptomyces odontomachi]|uniref:helix-turn-helix domain-containing protein n=1 Tax=Streptomyces odontomachi TaxID=2944940 RepID=UPI00210B08FE|nr:helix-turn-helix transcriptional regulator [Streptomyces sp. ODS25]
MTDTDEIPDERSCGARSATSEAPIPGHVADHGPDRYELLQRIYGYALRHSPRDPADVEVMADRLGVPPAEVESAVAQLTSWRLLRSQPGRGLVAVPPDLAVNRLLRPMEREIRARRLRIEEQRRRLMAFMPVFEAGLRTHQEQAQVELIEGTDDVRDAVTELAEQCSWEILMAQPGGRQREDELEEAAPRDIAALHRGVEMRILYQHTARYSRGTHSYVEQVSHLGAQVRTLHDQFCRLLVFDRTTALIPVSDSPHAAALVREPNVVAFMVGGFERLWLSAEPLVAGSGALAEFADDLKETIVQLLSEGMTDAAVARRLGMSLRTCRRHVAEIMASLDAASRFQAGYLLALHKNVR